MLKYSIMENEKDFVSYRYFPEGKGIGGELTVSKKDKTIIEEKLAPDDDFRWYFFKIYKRIKEFIDANEFREAGTIVWY